MKIICIIIEFEATKKSLDEDNLAEGERVFIERHLAYVEEQFRALSSPPKTVLAKVKYFYDRTPNWANKE